MTVQDHAAHTHPAPARCEPNEDAPSPAKNPFTNVQVSDTNAGIILLIDGSGSMKREGDLDVYTISGTAKNGQDYTRLQGRAVIKARKTSVNVVIQPIDDTKREHDETAILTLSTNTGYTIGSPNTATVVIHSNE